MAFIDTGAPTPLAPTVVLVHGNSTSSYVWRNIIPHLSPVARCIAPDFVGYGNSGRMPSNAYYFRDHVRYLDAFMDQVATRPPGTGKIFLVVQDWGSAVGLHWARRNAERVAGLVLMEFFIADMTFDTPFFQNFSAEGDGWEAIIEKNIQSYNIGPGHHFWQEENLHLIGQVTRDFIEKGEKGE